MTEVTIKSAPAQEDPAHVAAMLAKAEGNPPSDGGRPAWLPEGFNTPEELAAAYLASQNGTGGDPNEDPEENADPTPDDAAAVAAAAGLDMAALEAKVISGEGLADTDYAALEKAGIPKATVDAYIAGQVALGEQLVSRMHSHVGGEARFNAILDWAAAGNLTAAEVAVFNRTVDSGDETAIKLALSGLQARFAAAGNETPSLLGGGRSAVAGDVYESVAQMMDDMRNPSYSRDPAFRAKVEAKLARSNIL